MRAPRARSFGSLWQTGGWAASTAVSTRPGLTRSMESKFTLKRLTMYVRTSK